MVVDSIWGVVLVLLSLPPLGFSGSTATIGSYGRLRFVSTPHGETPALIGHRGGTLEGCVPLGTARTRLTTGIPLCSDDLSLKRVTAVTIGEGEDPLVDHL